MANVVNLIKQIQRTYSQFKPAFLQIENQFQAYLREVKKIEKLGKALAESRNSDYKAFGWLIEHNWPPLMYVPTNSPTKLMDFCTKKNLDARSIKKILDEEIVKYHDRRIIENDIFPHCDSNVISKQRIKIVQSCIQAHLDKKYELSVPALLSQLDGITSEYFNYSTNSIADRKEFFVSQKSISRDELMELMYRYLESKVFAGIGNNDSNLMEINRHKILHGVYVNYDKESVSLKLILIIDMLLTYPKYVSLPHSKKYHVPRCPSYRKATKNNKKKYRIIHTKYSASASGLEPCKRCLDIRNDT